VPVRRAAPAELRASCAPPKPAGATGQSAQSSRPNAAAAIRLFADNGYRWLRAVFDRAARATSALGLSPLERRTWVRERPVGQRHSTGAAGARPVGAGRGSPASAGDVAAGRVVAAHVTVAIAAHVAARIALAYHGTSGAHGRGAAVAVSAGIAARGTAIGDTAIVAGAADLTAIPAGHVAVLTIAAVVEAVVAAEHATGHRRSANGCTTIDVAAIEQAGLRAPTGARYSWLAAVAIIVALDA
jgi:hypothetical protein